VAKLVLGDGLDETTDVGPVINESAIERIPVEEYVSGAIRDLKAQELRPSARLPA